MKLRVVFLIICLSGVISLFPFHCFSQGRLVIADNDTTYYDFQPDEEEYTILEEFYKALNGKKWKKNTNWLKGRTIKEIAGWHGVVIKNGDVSEIHLDNNNLKGTVPKSIYKLSTLRTLSIDGNTLDDPSTSVSNQRVLMSTTATDQNFVVSSVGVQEQSSQSNIGANLPVWGLSVQGSKIKEVDWRKTPPKVSDLPNSREQVPAHSGVAINSCGSLTLFLHHSGVAQQHQLHIYSADGTLLTNNVAGSPLRALNSVEGQIELQVLQVPGIDDEWYVIYSLKYDANVNGYTAAKVAYARIKYNVADGFSILSRDVLISEKTFIQGKAVSRTVLGDPSRQYLYLAERSGVSNFLRLNRFIIDGNGIHSVEVSAANIPASYWGLGIAGSSIELSSDETKIAISNRNENVLTKEDLIVYNLSQFSSPSYIPIIIHVPDLYVHGTGRTIKELYTQGDYPCFRNLKNKLSAIEFSPSGRYLYVLNGGNPSGSTRESYNTYLLQIDLQSGTGLNDFEVRMQIEEGLGGVDPHLCLGTSQQGPRSVAFSQIQSAFDGRLYFSKSNSNKLFVMPRPDEPMRHSLIAVSGVTFAEVGIPDIGIGANVGILPENIDGFNYIKENTTEFTFNIDKTSITKGETINLTIPTANTSSTYQISWGDGSIESVSITSGSIARSHIYLVKGLLSIKVTVINSLKCAAIASKEITVIDCAFKTSPTMAIQHQQYRCATRFSIPKVEDCYASYLWNFGDQTTSTARSPMHVYAPGVYNVSVTITYNCNSCSDVLTFTKSGIQINAPGAPELENKTIIIPTDKRTNILSSGASTYSDTWPLDHNETALENLNFFSNGSQGVWRNEGSFVYNVERKSSIDKTNPMPSQQVNVSADGTYDLFQFNWPNSDLDAIPNWIKVNSITRYNAYSYELENKDPLAVYTAALYDYGGQLQSAQGINMRNDEMGFTSFETFNTLATTHPNNNKPSGNFIFQSNSVPAFNTYKVTGAKAYVATIEGNLENFENIEQVDIISKGYVNSLLSFFKVESRVLQNVKILCRETHPTIPGRIILVFETAPFEGIWIGEIRIKNRIVSTPKNIINSTIAHTGSSSIKIESNQVFEQRLIHLQEGKKYQLSAWVSINNPNISTPSLGNQVGIDVILKDSKGKVLGTTFILPEGNIIEGWQQVKGTFMCPQSDAVLSLKFKKGNTGPAWYDDLRIHPDNGNMKSFVYDLSDYRLKAILDENNFASIFYYDKEGNLYLTKKETEEGIQTVSENLNYQVGEN